MSDSSIDALHDSYAAARHLFDKGRVREALDVLLSAIDKFESVEGQHAAIVKPLILLADLFHRLEEVEEAHRQLDRALDVARSRGPSPSMIVAEAYCLSAVVEWKNKCLPNAVKNYQAGIAEGERVGANQQWLAYHFTGLAELLLETQYQPDAALTCATRAVELTDSAQGADSRAAFFARLALGRALLGVGMNSDAEKTFELLLVKRLRARAGPARGEDKLEKELRAWIATAKGAPSEKNG